MANVRRQLQDPLSRSTATSIEDSAAIPYTARAFVPAYIDLPRAAGVPAQLADEQFESTQPELVPQVFSQAMEVQ
jgi:hypothetical protein